jgi:hypothetical protein
MPNPIEVQNDLKGPTGCPTCKNSELFVATDGKGSPPTRSNPRGRIETFIGYDCRSCGQQLRFPKQL